MNNCPQTSLSKDIFSCCQHLLFFRLDIEAPVYFSNKLSLISHIEFKGGNREKHIAICLGTAGLHSASGESASLKKFCQHLFSNMKQCNIYLRRFIWSSILSQTGWLSPKIKITYVNSEIKKKKDLAPQLNFLMQPTSLSHANLTLPSN